MKTRIFISRKLSPNSAFTRRLSGRGYEVIGLSLLDFRAVPFGPLPEASWAFFYSKKAVRFFLEGLQEDPPRPMRWAAIGEGTARALRSAGLEPDFVGSGDPAITAAEFGQQAAGQRVLFPQARNSRQTVQQLLKGTLRGISLVVYDNQPKSVFDIPYCLALAFTSPMNARAYYGKYEVREEQLVVAIGETTADALRELGVVEVRVAEEPSEEALAEEVLSRLQG